MKTIRSKSFRQRDGLVFSLVLVAGVFAVGTALWLFRPVAASRASAAPLIDLAQNHWYAQQGFSDSDRYGFDVTVAGVQATEHLPILLNEVFEIKPGTGVHHFTLMTQFDRPPQTTAQALALGLAELGDNWVIYLNGVELRREFYITDDGQIRVHRMLQQVVIGLPPGALQPGINRLVIHVAGEAPATPILAN